METLGFLFLLLTFGGVFFVTKPFGNRLGAWTDARDIGIFISTACWRICFPIANLSSFALFFLLAIYASFLFGALLRTRSSHRQSLSKNKILPCYRKCNGKAVATQESGGP